MVRAMLATGLAQGLVAVITQNLGEGRSFILTASFVAPWLLPARLFRKAGRATVGRQP